MSDAAQMSLHAMAPTLFALYASRDIDWADAHNVWIVRVLFVVSTLLQLLVGLWCWSAAVAANDRRTLRVAATPPATGTMEQSVTDYDVAQIRTYLWQFVPNTLMIAFLHFKMEATIPVYFQIFVGLFRVWEWEMFRLHIWGETAQEFPALQRPFPVPPNPLAGLFSALNPPAEEPAAAAGAGAAAAAGAAAVAAPRERTVPRVEIIDDDDK